MALTARARRGLAADATALGFTRPWRRDRPRTDPYRKLNRRLLWAAPLGVAFVIFLVPFYLDKLTAAMAGLIALTRLGRKPGTAMKWLLCFLPFSTLLFAFLLKVGLPAQFVRPLGYWKEAMIVAIVVGGILGARKYQVKADFLDLACGAYILLSLAYLALPDVFVNGYGTQIAFGNRLQGYRSDAIYVLLFLAARHCRIPGRTVLRVARAFCAVAGIAAVVGLYEYFASASWSNFIVNTLGMSNYKALVLHLTPAADPTFYDTRIYTSVAGRSVLRVGGIVLNYQVMAFFLGVATCFLAELLVRRNSGRRGWVTLALPLAIVGVIITQTRSGLLIIGAALLIVVTRLPGRLVAARVRMTLVVGALGLLALPLVFSIGLADRLTGKDERSSNTQHANATRSGFDLMLDTPLGTGLGTGAGRASRAGTDTGTFNVSENQLLEIGTQLGIAGVLLWVTAYGTIVVYLDRSLRKRADSLDRDDAHPAAIVVAGARTVFIGMVPAMFFLQPLVFFAAAWPMWGLAGAALGSLEAAPAEEGEEPEYGARYDSGRPMALGTAYSSNSGFGTTGHYL